VEFFGCGALGAFWVIIDRLNEACHGICIADWAMFDTPMKDFLKSHLVATVTGKNNENARPTQQTKVMKSFRSH
jgi:hypothetical protein